MSDKKAANCFRANETSELKEINTATTRADDGQIRGGAITLFVV